MHDNDKTCFVFRTACLCPNSCATNDDRQMRMTDKDTPHAPKIMLTSMGPQQGTGNTLIKDRYHWPHRHDISSVIFTSLRLLQLLIIASSRSSSTIDRTPSRNSRNIVTLFPCLSTTIRSCGTHLHLALSVCMLFSDHAEFLCCPSATTSR